MDVELINNIVDMRPTATLLKFMAIRMNIHPKSMGNVPTDCDKCRSLIRRHVVAQGKIFNYLRCFWVELLISAHLRSIHEFDFIHIEKGNSA